MAFNQASNNFTFVTYTKAPDLKSKRNSSAVRRHVMDDYFRRHQGRDPRKHSSCPSALQFTSANAATWDNDVHPLPHTYSDLSRSVSPVIHRPSTSLSTLEDNNTFPADQVLTASSLHYTQLNVCSGLEQLDPFDALPVSGFPDQNELLCWIGRRSEISEIGNWELRVPWIHIFDSIYTKNLWDISMADKGLFYIMLCIGQARRSLVTGQYDRRPHITANMEMTRYVRERLSATGDADDDLLMLIACLARMSLAEDGDDTYGPAVLHMRAIQRLLLSPNFRGLRDIHWRAITGTDLRLASTLLTTPYLPLCFHREDPKLRAVPKEIRLHADSLTTITMTVLPEQVACKLRGFVRGLWILSMAYTNCNDQALASQQEALWGMQDVPYETIYRLCTLTAEDTETVFDMEQAILLAMRLYAWSGVPEYIPEKAQVKVNYGPFMKRVSKRALQRLHQGLAFHNSLTSWWRDECGAKLESLLWVLFVAWTIARVDCKNLASERMPPFHAADWFLARLRDVTAELGIRDGQELEVVLRMFPWADHFSANSCGWLGMQLV